MGERWKVGAVLLGASVFLSNVPPFQPSQWSPDERVLITDFSSITALAASPFLLFAATSNGLLVYDRVAQRWLAPVTRLDGYPVSAVQVALADATDDAVWLGTLDGWARYDTRIRQWQSGMLTHGVSDLALDAQDPVSGIYLRVFGGEWTFLPRGALLPAGSRPLPARVVRPLDPRTALAGAPQADAMRALLLTDARLRRYSFTSAARSADQSDLFLGTNGLGVIRVEGFGARWDVLRIGLPAVGATTLAAAPDGVWIGGVPRGSERDGLTWVASDLANTRWLEGTGTAGLGFREARRIVTRAGRIWVVTERGLARVDPATERADIFPVDLATTLAPAPDGIWVGTQRGLMHMTDSGRVTSFGVSDAVLSLLPAGDSLWVGTATGLALLAPGASAPRPPAELAAAPGLAAPIVALARRRDTVVAATPDQLAWRSPSGVWTLLRPGTDVGRITALAADRDGVWVGGDRSLAYWRIGARTFRARRVPADLPAGVRDVVVAHPYLWVATDGGVVRFLREAAIDR